jgi:hypothetical protein
MTYGVVVCLGALIVSNFLIVKCGPLDEEGTKALLQIFLPTLATISTLVFAIPLLFRSVKIGKPITLSTEIIVLIYLMVLISAIVVTLFVLIGILPPEQRFYKASVLLFLDSVILLILYSIVFLPKNMIDVIQSIGNPIMRKINPPIYEVIYQIVNSVLRKVVFTIWKSKSNAEWEIQRLRRIEEKIEIEIDILRQVLFQVLRDHSFSVFYEGIKTFEEIGKEIMRNPRFEDYYVNKILKEILESLYQLGVECITWGSNEGLRRIVKCMDSLIFYGLSNGRNELEYLSFVTSLIKLGKKIGFQDFDVVSDEIVECLGRTGVSRQEDFKYPCVMECLSGLGEIGIELAENRKENLSLMVLHRVWDIGYQEKQKGGKTIEHALKQIWILCAAVNKYIPEAREYICILQQKASKEFGPIFSKMLGQTISDLEQESFILKKMVSEFAKMC